jgi:hypothetical protein
VVTGTGKTQFMNENSDVDTLTWQLFHCPITK